MSRTAVTISGSSAQHEAVFMESMLSKINRRLEAVGLFSSSAASAPASKAAAAQKSEENIGSSKCCCVVM